MQQRRWVSYVYRYRQHGKCEIVGFVKIQRMNNRINEKARIQVGLKMYKGYPCECSVYLVKGAETFLFANLNFEARQRETMIHSVEIDWDNPLNNGIIFDEYEGVYIRCDDGEVMAGIWGENTCCVEDIYVDELSKVGKTGRKKGRQESWRIPGESVDREAVVTEEISKPISCKDFLKNYPKLPIFAGSQILDGVKIVPQDIGLLTPEIWKLGVNSFLSHGYYKYRYLMLGRVRFSKGDRYVIGVPGVFSNKEKYLANMFGFRVFVPEQKDRVNTGNFGYWVYEVPDKKAIQTDYIASNLHTVP